jgi:ribosome-associated protein
VREPGGPDATAPAKQEATAPRADTPAPAEREAAAPRADASAPAVSQPTPEAGAAAAPTPAPEATAAAPVVPPRPVRTPDHPRPPKVEPATLDRLVEAARRSLEDDKAERIEVLDVTGRADYADRLIVASGLVDRQLQAMATHLKEALEKEGLRMSRDRIQSSPDWVLIDAGDLVVHLFRPEAREHYAIERMWGPGSPDAEAPHLPSAGMAAPEAVSEDDEPGIPDEADEPGEQGEPDDWEDWEEADR